MYVCMYGHHTYSKSMDRPGKVANPTRGQLNRENEYIPVRVCACELGLARGVQQSRPASACLSPYSCGIVLTYGVPPEFRGGAHWVSPEFIGSRNYVPMAFTAESPPAQGQ